MRLRPITLAEAREGVRQWHSHHQPHRRHTLAVGAEEHGALVAVVVWERPKAQALCDGFTWELTRLAVGPDAPAFAASRLIGASTKAALAMGIRRCVSYTRLNERGTCYRAANWHPTAVVRGRGWDGENKPGRWLPGLYVPSTEIVKRVRWERGPDSAPTRWEVLEVAA